MITFCHPFISLPFVYSMTPYLNIWPHSNNQIKSNQIKSKVNNIDKNLSVVFIIQDSSSCLWALQNFISSYGLLHYALCKHRFTERLELFAFPNCTGFPGNCRAWHCYNPAQHSTSLWLSEVTMPPLPQLLQSVGTFSTGCFPRFSFTCVWSWEVALLSLDNRTIEILKILGFRY